VGEVVRGGIWDRGSEGWSGLEVERAEDGGSGGSEEASVVSAMTLGGFMKWRDSMELLRESGGLEGEMGRWVVEEEGDGENGSMEVARWRFARKELRNAA